MRGASSIPEREPKLTGDELRRLFRAITLAADPG